MDRRTGLRSDARANRARLVEAAHELFRERGLDAEMKDIAERAGVGVGTIYRNFPTKNDLLAAIVGEMLSHFRSVIAAATAAAEPADAIRILLRGGFAGLDMYGDVVMLLHRELPKETRAHFEAFDVTPQLAGIVERGIAAGVFRADVDAEVVAARIASSFHPPLYQRLRRNRTAEQIADAHADLILHGLVRRGAPDR